MARKRVEPNKPKTLLNVVPLSTKKRGEPALHAHEPTSATRQLVQVYCFTGLPQAKIASHLGISVPTLVKYYREELDHGKEKMLAKVSSTIFAIATQNRDLKASLTASIFILKTQAGWVEGGKGKGAEDDLGRKVVVSLNIGDKEPKVA